jgi:hypothetical protein
MFNLLVDVQRVEIVGGESWLWHNSVAIAAIAAAVLAALVAVSNRRAQLKHDRELRSRDYVRDSIDAAIIAANEVRTAVDRFVIAVTGFEKRRGSLQPSQVKATEAGLVERRDEVMRLLQGMRAARSRLEIRLDDSSPVTSTYRSILEGYLDVLGGVHEGIVKNRGSDSSAGDAEREKKVRTHFRSFQRACREWFEDAPQKDWIARIAAAARCPKGSSR